MKTKGKSGVMDMTQGNMAMLILSFALPLMLGNVFQQFYTVADTAIVGKILGVDALAALGTVESINWLVLGTIQGITQGFGILVSQQFGAKKEEALQETIFHASFLAVVAAILFTMGLFPILGAVFTQLPKPVVGGVTLLMFATVATAGIRILSTVNFTHRNILIIATSLGLSMGIAFVPDVFAQTPQLFRNIFGSAVTMSGIVAITLDMILPKNYGVEFDTSDQHIEDGLKPVRMLPKSEVEG